MQVILSLLVVGFISLIFLSFLTCRICFFEEYAIFTLGRLRFLKLKGRSYAYLIYLIVKHTGKKNKKIKHKKKKPIIQLRKNICIFVRRYETLSSIIMHYYISLFNYLLPRGYDLSMTKIQVKTHKEFGIGIAIRMLF